MNLSVYQFVIMLDNGEGYWLVTVCVQDISKSRTQSRIFRVSRAALAQWLRHRTWIRVTLTPVGDGIWPQLPRATEKFHCT